MNSQQNPANAASVLTQLSTLYSGDGLPDLLTLLDDLHSAVTEGELPRFTTLSTEEVSEMLKELVYVAQETLRELNQNPQKQAVRRPRQPVLRLVQPDSTPEQRQA